MKSVLISIQPKWCELIASGKKTVEVRKTKPKLDTPFKCYIYCTKGNDGKYFWTEEVFEGKLGRYAIPYVGNGKVIGEFVCNKIIHYDAEFWDDETFECIREIYEPLDFDEYGEYVHYTIADNGDDNWRENKLCQLSCLTIDELRKYIGQGINEFYGWRISDLVIYDKPRELSEFRLPCDHKNDCCTCERAIYTMDKANICSFHRCSLEDGLTRPPMSWGYVESEGTE